MVTFTRDTLPPWPVLRNRDPAAVIDRRADAKVGAVVFIHDPNTRYYTRDPGGPTSLCIERYHYVARQIVGETRVSWVLEFGEKAAKRANVIFGRLDVEDALTREVFRAQLYHAIISFDADDARLAGIAELLGMTSYKAGDHPGTVGRALMDVVDADLIRRVGSTLDITSEH